jgi:hypothetical protein
MSEQVEGHLRPEMLNYAIAYSRLQKACRFSVLGVPHFFLAAF